MNAEEYLELMEANGVEAAIVGTAATCPNCLARPFVMAIASG